MPPSSLLRSLPYTVHTNRELGLMLAGKKPLATFIDRENFFPECLLRYLRLFDRYVEIGRLRRFDQFSVAQAGWRSHCIFFTLPGEEWRVDAYLDLFAREGAWSQQREREQGALLGYTEWENDVWEQHFPFRPA